MTHIMVVKLTAHGRSKNEQTCFSVKSYPTLIMPWKR